ncbi:MAG: oligosaccharide flippase family protein [Flavobacteriales bacterium]|nr:oligosaccharide flippase family protein [Bacteroidota bacterium]MCB9240485.1 oligosaccharide flippase family protein [Flavobacteriales bacterium]
MEQRKFVSDLLFVQFSNILIKAIWILVIDRAVQNLLPAEDYGRYFSVFSFTILFIILLDLGFNNLNARSVATNSAFYRDNFSSIMLLKLILALLFLLVLSGIGVMVGFSSQHLNLLLPLGIFQIFISFNQYLRSNLAGSGRYRWDGLIAVTDRALVVVILGSWMLVESWQHLLTIRNVVLVQVLGVLVAFAFGLILNRKFLGIPRITFHPDRLKDLVKKALPFAVLAALMALYTRVDAVMIDLMLDSVETDRYAMAYRLLDAGSMVAVLFSGMLLPQFSRLLNDRSGLSDTVKLSIRLLILPAVLFAVIVALHPNELLGIMYPNKLDIIDGETFRILMFSFVSTCAIYVFGTLLTAAADLRFLNLLAAACVVLNILLNGWLIPRMGIAGAAWATLLTQLAFALGCVLRSQFKHKVLQETGWIGYSVMKVLAVGAIYFVTKQYFENVLVHMAVGVVLALLIVVQDGLEHIGMLKGLNRRKT